MILVLDGPHGPNECYVNHSPEAQRIYVESKFRLESEGMREVEGYLNLKMQLGVRWMVSEVTTITGVLTIWDYLETQDTDWR